MSEFKKKRNIKMELSRLNITRDIDTNTPLIVLYDIAEAHDIIDNQYVLREDEEYTNIELIEKIYKTPIKKIELPYDEQDFINIAKYINKNCEWTREILIKAFNFLQQFSNIQEYKITEEFCYGSQTQNMPFNFNACIIYRLCKIYKIPMEVNTTINQMLVLLTLADANKNITRSIFYDHLMQHNNRDLINLYIYSCKLMDYRNVNIPPQKKYKSIKKEPIDCKKITTCISELKNIDLLLKRV